MANEPRARKSPLIPILLAVGALFFCLPVGCIGVITLFADDIRKRMAPASPRINELVPAPYVRTRTADGTERVAVAWRIDFDRPRYNNGAVDVSLEVSTASGQPAHGARAVVFWGDEFAANTVVDHRVTSVTVWPTSPGAPRAVAFSESEGAAVLECRRAVSDGSSWRCGGTLDTAMALSLPAPPRCPDDAWTPFFNAFAPGLCFGLTAEEMSRAEVPLVYVRMHDADDLMPLPTRDGPGPRFNIPLRGRATHLSLSESRAATEVFSLLTTTLQQRFGAPERTRHVCGATYRYGSEGEGAAVETKLRVCHDADGALETVKARVWAYPPATRAQAQ